jgi:hypothetical protein
MCGTNTIAAVLPGRDGAPLSIDMSLSEVARGELMVDADEGQGIPLGWALDKRGNPATDPKAGLEDSMLPAGGVKGAMLDLVGRTGGHGAHRRTDGLHSLSMKGINPRSARLFWSSTRGAGGQRGLQCPN